MAMFITVAAEYDTMLCSTVRSFVIFALNRLLLGWIN